MSFVWRTMAMTICLLPTLQVIAEPRNDEVGSFGITDYEIEAFLRSQYSRDTDEGVSRVSSSQLRFEEGVRVDLDAFIYHPNLIDISGNFEVGFSQDMSEINDTRRDENTTLLGYDLSADILSQKSLSGRIDLSYRDRLVSRVFAGPYEVSTRSEGAELRWIGPARMQLNVEHRALEEDGDLRARDENILYARYSAVYEADPNRQTELTFEFEDNNANELIFNTDGSVTAQDVSTQKLNLDIRNNWRFGSEEHPIELDGQFRLERSSGFFERDLLFLLQRLQIEHTGMLSSYYEVLASSDSTETQDDRTLHGTAGIILNVYDSLDMTMEITGEDRQFTDGDTQRYGGRVFGNYRKITPIGYLRCDLLLERQYQQENFPTGRIQITDEAVNLSSPGFIQLQEPSILLNSIRVTDPTNTIVYIEGIDYTVRQTGAFTEIQRLVGGSIPPGQTVLVDYASTRGRQSEFTTDRIVLGARLDFDRWPIAIYGRMRQRTDTLEGGDDPGNLQVDRQYLVGMEIEFTFFANIILSAEYEIREFNLSPSWDGYRVRGTANYPLGDNAAINMSITYESLDYRNAAEFGLGPDEDYLRQLNATASLVTRVSRDMLLRVEAQHFAAQGRQEDVQTRFGAEFTWRRGLLDLSISGHYSIYEQGEDSGDSFFIQLEVSRKF